MPKIETYNFDENISDNDFLLGTDVDEDNKTKSYKIRTLINKIKAEVELTAFIQVETLPIEDIQLNTIYILPNGDWNYYNGTIWLSNSNRPYKVYTALLNQSGTNAPVDTVLENTLNGNVTFSFISNGIFEITIPVQVNYNKVFILCPSSFKNKNAGVFSDVLIDLPITTNNFKINVKELNFATNYLNSMLDKFPIEIRVYN